MTHQIRSLRYDKYAGALFDDDDDDDGLSIFLSCRVPAFMVVFAWMTAEKTKEK